jgi:hypothetical protein
VPPDRPLFSSQHATRLLGPRIALALIASVLASYFVRESAPALIIVWMIFGVVALRDVHRYAYARHRHSELSSKYGEAYDEVLSSAIEDKGLSGLIFARWFPVEVALMNRLNTREL